MFSLITIVILAIAVFLGGYIVLKATIKEQTPQASTTPVQDGAAVPPTIEPLLNFNFLETKPLPYRPFLTNQHVSMGRCIHTTLQTHHLSSYLTSPRHQENGQDRVDSNGQRLSLAY
jgi:hypothetical protein